MSVKDSSGQELAPGSYTLTSVSGQNYLTAATDPVVFSKWAGLNNLTGADALPLSDTNNNGVPNLLEYAFGQDPVAPGLKGGPVADSVMENGQRYLTLAYERPAGAGKRSDLTYVPERATSLNPSNWSAAAADVISTTAPLESGTTETVTVRSMRPNTGGSEFLRLKVILPQL